MFKKHPAKSQTCFPPLLGLSGMQECKRLSHLLDIHQAVRLSFVQILPELLLTLQTVTVLLVQFLLLTPGFLDKVQGFCQPTF